ILGARPINTDEALRYGFLDAVVDGDLGDTAVEYARALLAQGKGPRRTRERSVDPATGTQEIFDRFVARAKEQYPNRVAPLTAIEAVRASLRLPVDKGLLYEDELVNGAKTTVESRAAV